MIYPFHFFDFVMTGYEKSRSLRKKHGSRFFLLRKKITPDVFLRRQKTWMICIF